MHSVGSSPSGPLPRVIVNVESLGGGHAKKKVVRTLRRKQWKPSILCYRIGYPENRYLRGWTRVDLRVAKSGKVTE